MGVAILPRSDAERPGTDVVVAALTEPSLRRDITLACREGRRLGPAAAEFLELSKELFTARRGGRLRRAGRCCAQGRAVSIWPASE